MTELNRMVHELVDRIVDASEPMLFPLTQDEQSEFIKILTIKANNIANTKTYRKDARIIIRERKAALAKAREEAGV